jgi:2-keto-4-pentenoate hydratase/2-oxohepta-3-ene-1,7-dioic acid hydratase in catechol pathway
LNFSEHVKESAILHNEIFDEKLPTEPVLFSKIPNVLIGNGENIVIPSFLKTDYTFEDLRVNYEAELAVIIKDRCNNVPGADALEHVLGHNCINDVSMINIQLSDKSGWFPGKSLDSFGLIGRYWCYPGIFPILNHLLFGVV